MKIESLFTNVSTTLVRAGPAERQGNKGAEEPRNRGAEERDPLSTPESPHPRTEGTTAPDKDKAEIKAQDVVEPVINGLQVGLEFIKDQATGQRIIKVYDRQSGDLIRQIPPEEVLSFLRQVAAGKGALVSRRL
jgi:flagellar protein FlaG